MTTSEQRASNDETHRSLSDRISNLETRVDNNRASNDETHRSLSDRISNLETRVDNNTQYTRELMRLDIATEKFDSLKRTVEGIDERLDKLLEEKQWLVRIVLSAVVLAVLALVLKQPPG